MNIIAIIQARVNSTRLPGKVLLDLEGKTVLERVVERVCASKLVNAVVVATTTNNEDLRIAEVCEKIGINVFCGSENDVLDRYFQAANHYKADQIVRITADCPMIDPGVIDEVIALHLKEKADYTSNTLKETFPDGLDVEVIKYKSLKKAWEEARLKSEREHVTPYITNRPKAFKQVNFESKMDFSKKRWTLDNPEDYEFIKIIYKSLYPKNKLFGFADVLKYLSENGELEAINMHIKRNEGYLKSLQEDGVAPQNSGDIQQKVWINGEADNWFKRNKDALTAGQINQAFFSILDFYKIKPRKILEIGCSNGYRLAALCEKYGAEVFGVEPSQKAIDDGKKKFPFINFAAALAESFSFKEKFDLIILGGVLCWVSRKNLLKAISNVNDHLAEDGFLILDDFGTDNFLKRNYHHLKDQGLFTYKQRYQDIFSASGLYQRIAELRFNHDTKEVTPNINNSNVWTVCLLRKNQQYTEY